MEKLYYKIVRKKENGRLVSGFLDENFKYFRIYRNDSDSEPNIVLYSMCYDSLKNLKKCLPTESNHWQFWTISGEYIGTPASDYYGSQNLEDESKLVESFFRTPPIFGDSFLFPQGTIILKNAQLVEKIERNF